MMVSVSADLIIGRLISKFDSEASLLRGVGEEINVLKLELSAIGSFLTDAEKKNGLTEGEKTWVTHVKDIAYPVELIIDRFTYHIHSQQVGGHFTRFLHKTLYLPKNIRVRCKIATKLQKINKTLGAISIINRRYGVERVEGSSSSRNDESWMRNLGELSVFTNEDHIVGIEQQKQLLMKWLVGGEPNLTHFSLFGMGGSGKTTLAAKTYNDSNVKRHFGCHAWITVSQTYVMDDLLRRLIIEFFGTTKERIPPGLNSMSYRDLLSLLVNYLRTRRYLVVLDDVWDANLLMVMAVVFQDMHIGSRIVVTTRNEDIASFSFGVPSHRHHIEPLSEAESWSLFSMKAFSSSCPPGIDHIARELVRRCKGLPLAIVTLGGLMASKTSTEEWGQVLDSLTRRVTNIPMLDVVTDRILSLSFNDLPYRLKQCFLYCSIFPEDHLIRKERLIRLWLAEGFVEEVNRYSPTEVARSYLTELISRSMLQVDYQRSIHCKMHDLMRELALSISEREKLVVVFDGGQRLQNHQTRRVSVQTSDDELKSYQGMPQLCSLLVFVKDLATTHSLSDVLNSEFKLLRVLDLEGMPIDKVPRTLPFLFNLTYLNLRRTSIKELPESIGNLLNLETLDICNAKIEKLPNGITKCKKLRYLYAFRQTGKFSTFKHFNGARVPSDICKLEELEIMHSIEAEGDIIKQIGKMTKLKKIGISNVREEDGMNLCALIQKLKLLDLLHLAVAGEEELLKIEEVSSPPPLLNILNLGGKMERVPRWFHLLQSLTSLKLHWSRLTDDPLPSLGALPCLGELHLVKAYDGTALNFLTGFVKLRFLTLGNFSETREIVIGNGVMPDLRQMRLDGFMELKMFPLGIEQLVRLKVMQLEEVSEELVERIRGEGGVDRARVKHIRVIDYFFPTANGMGKESLS